MLRTPNKLLATSTIATDRGCYETLPTLPGGPKGNMGGPAVYALPYRMLLLLMLCCFRAAMLPHIAMYVAIAMLLRYRAAAIGAGICYRAAAIRCYAIGLLPCCYS
jgi:hypothetical protein